MKYADFDIPVKTEDGIALGTLSSVEGPFMRVSRGLFRRPLHIPTEYIVSANVREVVVGFPSTQVARFNVPRPPTAPEPVEERKAA